MAFLGSVREAADPPVICYRNVLYRCVLGGTAAPPSAVAEAGDVVEIGIPFSDPMADGMTIQRSSFEALQKGVSLKWIFDELDSAAGEIDAPLVMMSYLNPLLAFGYEALAERALGLLSSTRQAPGSPRQLLRAALQ